MLWTIFVILLILWGLGLITGYTMGGVIHVLLVIAIIVILIQVIQGTKTSITVSILNGSDEAFGKEVVNRPERFYRIYEPFSRKGLVIN